jgi:hypothetical protein
MRKGVIKLIRGIIETYYDIQAMRIEVENQLRSASQGVSEQDEKWTKVNVLNRLASIEKDIAKYTYQINKTYPIYTEWLENIKGIGDVLAAGLTSWTGDIERFATISKLWAYCGLAVNEEGRAVRRKAGQKSNWNTRLKTHLWKIGESFVKQQSNKSGYRKLYEEFRADYDKKWVYAKDCGSAGCASKGEKKGKERLCMKGHRYAAAKRKTIKVFLAHYWMKSRQLKGLEAEHPFIIGRNGHEHLIDIIEM